jgi:hypothetical protein
MELEEDIARQMDYQLVLEETVRLSVKDYFKGIKKHKWIEWELEVGNKYCRSRADREKMMNLVNFKSARFFIFDRWGLQYLLEMTGEAYPLISLGELRRCCSDIDYLQRMFPSNPFLPGQTTVQPTEDDDEYAGSLPFLWKEYIEGPITRRTSFGNTNVGLRVNDSPVV